MCPQCVLMRLSITAVSGCTRKGEQSRLDFLVPGLLLVPINAVIKSADASKQTFLQRKANERKKMAAAGLYGVAFRPHKESLTDSHLS